MNNANGAVWELVTVTATLGNDSTSTSGHVFVPKTPEAFNYDADGNLLSDGRWNYRWDLAHEIERPGATVCRSASGPSVALGVPVRLISRAKENRLVQAESRSDVPSLSRRKVVWQYDALGRRIRQTTWTWNAGSGAWVLTEDLKFVSDPTLFGRHIAELRASDNALVRTYVWGLDLSGTEQGAGGVGGLLWLTSFQLPASSSSYFAPYDGNGNVAALLHAPSSMPHAHYEYGPFGEPLRVTGPAASLNPFRFSTKRTDPTTALVLYEYRVYSPTLGRWLSRDPVGELRGQAAYGFCTNDSVDAYDLFGLCDGSCGRLVGILAPSPIPAFPFPIPPPVPLPTPGSPAHKAACDTAAAIARSFLTSPEEIRAWDRFVSGKAPDVVELTREEMGSVLSAAPKFQADLSVQAEECKTALSYWSDRTKQIDDSIGSPWTRALGQVTITVTTLCGCRALAWKACIDDKYDFDPTWFRGGRTRQAEVETILVWLAQNVGFCGWKEYRHKGCQDGIIAL